MYVYIQVYKDTCQKFPSSLVKCFKMPVHFSTGKCWTLRAGEVSDQAPSSALGNNPLSIRWALRDTPERWDCWPQCSVAQESSRCLSQDHGLQACEITDLVISQSICTLAAIKDKNFTQKSNNSNTVPLRLTFRQKERSKAICWKTGAH